MDQAFDIVGSVTHVVAQPAFLVHLLENTSRNNSLIVRLSAFAVRTTISAMSGGSEIVNCFVVLCCMPLSLLSND